MTRWQSTFCCLSVAVAYAGGWLGGHYADVCWASLLPLIGPALSVWWIWRRQTRDAMGRYERKEDLLP